MIRSLLTINILLAASLMHAADDAARATYFRQLPPPPPFNPANLQTPQRYGSAAARQVPTSATSRTGILPAPNSSPTDTIPGETPLTECSASFAVFAASDTEVTPEIRHQQPLRHSPGQALPAASNAAEAAMVATLDVVALMAALENSHRDVPAQSEDTSSDSDMEDLAALGATAKPAQFRPRIWQPTPREVIFFTKRMPLSTSRIHPIDLPHEQPKTDVLARLTDDEQEDYKLAIFGLNSLRSTSKLPYDHPSSRKLRELKQRILEYENSK